MPEPTHAASTAAPSGHPTHLALPRIAMGRGVADGLFDALLQLSAPKPALPPEPSPSPVPTEAPPAANTQAEDADREELSATDKSEEEAATDLTEGMPIVAAACCPIPLVDQATAATTETTLTQADNETAEPISAIAEPVEITEAPIAEAQAVEIKEVSALTTPSDGGEPSNLASPAEPTLAATQLDRDGQRGRKDKSEDGSALATEPTTPTVPTAADPSTSDDAGQGRDSETPATVLQTSQKPTPSDGSESEGRSRRSSEGRGRSREGYQGYVPVGETAETAQRAELPPASANTPLRPIDAAATLPHPAETAPPAAAQTVNPSANAQPTSHVVVAAVSAMTATSDSPGRGVAPPIQPRTAATIDGPGRWVTSAEAPPAGSDAARPAAAEENSSPPGSSNLDRARLIQRVTRAFHKLGEGGGSVRVRLYPPNLGAVRVDVQLEGVHMRAKLTAESEGARAVLQDQLSDLRQRLTDQGIQVDQIEVDVEQPFDASTFDGQQQSHDRFAEQSTPRQRVHERERDRTKAFAAEATAPRELQVISGGLDLRA